MPIRTSGELDQIVLYIGPADEEHRDTVGESLQQDIAAVASAIAKIAGKEVRVGNPEPVGESSQFRDAVPALVPAF